jgi:hypothetical protein
MGVTLTIILSVLVPCIVSETTDLAPWLAECVVRWGARQIGVPEKTARYEEEWLADLEEVSGRPRVPGKITKLAWACGTVARSVPALRLQFAREADALVAQVHAGTVAVSALAEQVRQLTDAHGRRRGRSAPVAMLLAAAVARLGVALAAELAENLWDLGLKTEAFRFTAQWLRFERIRERQPQDVLVFFQRLLRNRPGDREELQLLITEAIDQWSWINKHRAQEMLGKMVTHARFRDHELIHDHGAPGA